MLVRDIIVEFAFCKPLDPMAQSILMKAGVPLNVLHKKPVRQAAVVPIGRQRFEFANSAHGRQNQSDAYLF